MRLDLGEVCSAKLTYLKTSFWGLEVVLTAFLISPIANANATLSSRALLLLLKLRLRRRQIDLLKSIRLPDKVALINFDELDNRPKGLGASSR